MGKKLSLFLEIIFLVTVEVPDPERFGVAEIDGNKIIRIVEKPKHPKSNYANVGVYMYDSEVFDIVKTLKPSNRGELEITDVNNSYIEKGLMEFDFLPGYWTDSGTFYSLVRANLLAMDEKDRRQLIQELKDVGVL
jgi:glucose-1-phosphate thymidylyltransferase